MVASWAPLQGCVFLRLHPPNLKLDVLVWQRLGEEGGPNGGLLQGRGTGLRGQQGLPPCSGQGASLDLPPCSGRGASFDLLAQQRAGACGPIPTNADHGIARTWLSKYWPRTNLCTILVLPHPISPSSTSLCWDTASTILIRRLQFQEFEEFKEFETPCENRHRAWGGSESVNQAVLSPAGQQRHSRDHLSTLLKYSADRMVT